MARNLSHAQVVKAKALHPGVYAIYRSWARTKRVETMQAHALNFEGTTCGKEAAAVFIAMGRAATCPDAGSRLSYRDEASRLMRCFMGVPFPDDVTP